MTHDQRSSEIETTRVQAGRRRDKLDRVLVEEPLLIRVNGDPLATLMRLPGDDVDLAVGYLVTEGVVRSLDEVAAIAHCEDGDMGDPNVVDVRIPGMAPHHARQASRLVFSSCGLCGAVAIDDLCRIVGRFDLPHASLAPSAIHAAMAALERRQPTFSATGGSHGALLTRLTELTDPDAGVVREDVGRHCAVDKVIGAACKEGWLGGDLALLLSGRLSYEIVSKCARSGIGYVAGVSAATGLAVGTARALGMFLAGFVRADRMNVYSGSDALISD